MIDRDRVTLWLSADRACDLVNGDPDDTRRYAALEFRGARLAWLGTQSDELIAALDAALDHATDIDAAIAEGRLAAVREVADWLGVHRGRRDDGQVYADLAELKLRTALGEHKPDAPCACAACGRSQVGVTQR